MGIVPNQPEADEVVIAFWAKKLTLTAHEVAALAAGINPTALRVAFGEEPDPVIRPKLSTMNEILTVIIHRLDGGETTEMPAAKWSAFFKRWSLPFPDSLTDAESCANDQTEKPLHPRSRTTLLTIIGVLASVSKLEIDKTSKAAQFIVAEAALRQIELDPRTVAEILKEVPDALERRRK